MEGIFSLNCISPQKTCLFSFRGTLYKSSIDCVRKTVKQEGFVALYKGFLPIWMRMAPWSLSFWLTYEEVMSLMGAKSW